MSLLLGVYYVQALFLGASWHFHVSISVCIHFCSYFVLYFICITKNKWRGSVSTFHDIAKFHSFLTPGDMNCRHPNNHAVQSTSVQVLNRSLVLPTFSPFILFFRFIFFLSLIFCRLPEATKLLLLLLQAQLFSVLKFWVTWRNAFPRGERGDFLDNNKSKRNIKQPMLVFLHLKYKVVQRISLLIHCYN